MIKITISYTQFSKKCPAGLDGQTFLWYDLPLNKKYIFGGNFMSKSYDLLLSKQDVCTAFVNTLKQFFTNNTEAVQTQLIMFCTSIFMLNCVKPIRYMYEHCIKEFVQIHLNNFYKALNNQSSQSFWVHTLIQLVIKIIPPSLIDMPIYLIIDDTLTEKYGQHFEDVALLFDHCARNGTNYLNGHCFVTLVIAVPVLINGNIHYIKIPIEHRLWVPKKQRTTVQDENNKLELAKAMIEAIIQEIGMDRKFIILADAWYAKDPLTELVDRKDVRIGMLCAARVDSKLFNLPKEYCGKGRRPKYGTVINIKQLAFVDIPSKGYRACHVKGKARIFGDREISIYVTNKNGSYRVFICTDPSLIVGMDPTIIHSKSQNLLTFLRHNKEYLPLIAYDFRWSIEVIYNEQKTNWGLQDYRLRSENGFTTLVNLTSLMYAITSILPYIDAQFETCEKLSIQGRRSWIGKALSKKLVLSTFVSQCVSAKNYDDIYNVYSNFKLN